MRNDKYHCALFDVDGTLVDSSGAHGMAWHGAFKKFGFEISVATITEDIGMGGMEIVRKHLSSKQAEKLGRQIADSELSLFQKEFAGGIKPFPYATELIHHLADRGINIILASSAPREVVEKFIDLLEIRKDIVNYVTGSDVVHAKPAPDIFQKALMNCCPAKRGTVVVGDSPYDIQAASRAGLPTIAVLNNGFDKKKLKGAKYIFKNIKELYKYADTLFADEGFECPIKQRLGNRD